MALAVYLIDILFFQTNIASFFIVAYLTLSVLTVKIPLYFILQRNNKKTLKQSVAKELCAIKLIFCLYNICIYCFVLIGIDLIKPKS